MQLARRTTKLRPFLVVDFLEAAKRLEAEGRDIIHMEVGEPTFPTPEPIIAAAHTALDGGNTFYTQSCGIPPLREAIAADYHHRYGVDVNPRQIIVTTGSSAALGMALDLLLNPGDGLLLADPGYPCNPNFAHRAGAEVQRVPVSAAQNYQLSAESVASHWRKNTKAALVASPSNPTGTVIGAKQLRGLHQVVMSHHGALVVDEIYHGLTYFDSSTDVACGEMPVSALTISDDLIVINSFSKFYGMTGWRLGWMVVPESVVGSITVMAQNFYISPPTLSQYAALAAFQPETQAILEQRRQDFQRRRDFLVPALRDLGFVIPQVPQGGFYIYADISRLAEDSEAFCWELLRQQGVACTPGLNFGEYRPRQHVRFAYTAPLERLEEAVARIARFL